MEVKVLLKYYKSVFYLYIKNSNTQEFGLVAEIPGIRSGYARMFAKSTAKHIGEKFYLETCDFDGPEVVYV